MTYLVRTLLALLVLEIVVCGFLFSKKLFRTEPAVPGVEFSDPLFRQELEKLADNARNGSDKDWQILGEALVGDGFYTHAIINFQQAIKSNPKNVDARFGLAFCLDKIGRTEESTEHYQKFIKVKTGTRKKQHLNHNATYAIGRNYLREEKIKEAELAFRKNKAHSASQYQIAKMMLRDDRLENALKLIESNLKERPLSLKWNYLNYNAMKMKGDSKKAHAAAAMVERSAYIVELNFNHTYIEAVAGKYGLANQIDEYKQLQAKWDFDGMDKKFNEIFKHLDGRRIPAYSHALVFKVQSDFKKENAIGMLDTLQKLKDFGGDTSEMTFFEGHALALQGNTEDALKSWKRTALVSPNYQVSHLLASTYEKMGDKKLATFHTSQALLQEGISIFRENNTIGGLEKVQESIDLNPDHDHAWFYKGIFNNYLRKPELAKKSFEQCLKLNPYHGRAKKELAAMK